MSTPAKASLPVIKRLPKYYRYLRSLQEDGINSISSRELAAQMGTTASQVRQDFNCIGDVNGRQGIGYSVRRFSGKCSSGILISMRLFMAHDLQ